MIVNTRRLFCRLLRTLNISTVCDVGSMDGSDALRFRRMLPNAIILALEPNPQNFKLMAVDEKLRRAGIRILPLAASDRASTAPFFVVEADYSPESQRAWRGMSSLHRRADASLLAEIVQVATVRLDELLAAESLANGPIALWIDTEGMAFEVIRGAAAVTSAIRLLHVEVETRPVIGPSQKLFADVEEALTKAGFVLLATDQPRSSLQLNALFVRADLVCANARTISVWLHALRLRRIVARSILPFVPRALARALAG